MEKELERHDQHRMARMDDLLSERIAEVTQRYEVDISRVQVENEALRTELDEMLALIDQDAASDES